jgi:uncharacterized protein (TIGR02466 family)
MSIRLLFPTLVYAAPLIRTGSARLNRELLADGLQIRREDGVGRRWSARRYPGGYTSYSSLCQLHRLSSTFMDLERRVDRHVRRYTQALALDLDGRQLVMTDCWLNVMGKGAVHGLHLHPISTLSGTYYVQTPRGCSGLKIEDPRLDRFMAAPPKLGTAPVEQRPWITLPARAGHLVLFESWLRHEVPPNPVAGNRVSVSFNYHWA